MGDNILGIVWYQKVGSEEGIYYKRYNLFNGWNTDPGVKIGESTLKQFPDIKAITKEGDGKIIVIWAKDLEEVVHTYDYGLYT